VSRLRWGIAALCILLAAGCRQGASTNPDTAATTAVSDSKPALRIGFQKGGALNVLRLRGDLEKRLAPQGVSIQWLEFPAGPQTLEAIGTGSVDISSMGDAPPVFAQAAGIPVVYVANQPPGDASGRAILVSHDSPIRTVADLRGKRIAIQKGSGTHNFLIQALQRAGVPYDQVKPAYLSPPDARAAFDSGSVDAWAIWDPFMTVARRKANARVLIDGAGTVSAGGFYVSSRDFATHHPDLIRATLEEADRTSVWIEDHPHEAAEILSKAIKVDVATLEEIQRRTQKGRRHVGYRPIDADVIKTQQLLADNFYRVGLLPKPVDIRTGLLTPAQYAALTPDGGVATAKR